MPYNKILVLKDGTGFFLVFFITYSKHEIGRFQKSSNLYLFTEQTVNLNHLSASLTLNQE